jgi:hypothetical protein
MQSPFPGMDPYLEDPALWPEFHRRLVGMMHLVLFPALNDRYRLAIGTRRYAATEEDYLEIRQTEDQLVTSVEVVSPANRTTDAGRQAYLDKRRHDRESQANIVEIDLVLQGQQMLDYSREGLPDWDHAVTVTRATHPERYEIYTATVQKRLPRFRLPLAADDRDTVLDLQAAFTRCYAEGRYAERIDYGREPPAPLDEEDRRWLDELLKTQRRRDLFSHEEVAVAAYYFWEREGRPQGRDKEHWQQAVAELRRGK